MHSYINIVKSSVCFRVIVSVNGTFGYINASSVRANKRRIDGLFIPFDY